MSLTSHRMQQTLARPARVSGFGLFQGCDVTVEFCPAPCDHGIVFERIDLATPVRIPALIEYVVPQNRCTVISCQGASVSVIEHVMAALAGMRVDNCLVRINAPEPPGCDGSSAAFVDALLQAGIVTQDQPRLCVEVDQQFTHLESPRVGIAVQPSTKQDYQIGFLLDYGPGPIPFQALSVAITPTTFLEQLSHCRTFVLQAEVEQLRAAGMGLRATPENVLVFTENGVLENALRWPDECVRHKILDCVGDFALLGYDLIGRFTASRSGHRLNHEIIRLIRQASFPEAALSTATTSSPTPASHSGVTHKIQSPHFDSPRLPDTPSFSDVQG
ncbi:UDP-3-O-acyl-N-acetylglucosamine deacetylase [Planctomicrobium sp. SH661]|uniref:UDP-3-O-acyl-N-acetylglucosamine deacetylase n=1 Tax=Planctomicrobium sp. SH661 TaxID=3448124 RepID=UPI003F5C4340